MNLTLSGGTRMGTITIPCSKSQAHRMLICAALSDAPSCLCLNATNDDIAATVRCLRALGAAIDAQDGALHIRPLSGAAAHTAQLDVGESGSTLRFLLPVLGALGVHAEDSNGMVSLDKGDSRNVMLNISSTNIGLESVTMIATSSLFDEHKISSSLDLLKLSEESKKKLAEIGLEVPALDDKKAMFTLVFDNLITQLPGGTHTFVLSARDEMGHETVQTISITVNLQIKIGRAHV